MPLYAAVHNPYIATVEEKQKLRWATPKQIAEITEALKQLGYDGAVLVYSNGSLELVAYDPTAVKSAVGNNGDFGPSDRIAFSRTAASPLSSPLRDRMERIVDSLIYNFQDRFKPLRDIQKRLQPASEEQDVVLAEGLYSGILPPGDPPFGHARDSPITTKASMSWFLFMEVSENRSCAGVSFPIVKNVETLPLLMYRERSRRVSVPRKSDGD